MNGIEYFDEEYLDVVSYILTPDSSEKIVEIVIDANAWSLMDYYSRTGSNMLMEYQDTDGYTYVLFGFWDVFIYRVKICRNKATVKNQNLYYSYFYHTDGTSANYPVGVAGTPDFAAKEPEDGLNSILGEVKKRLSNLGERDLSIEYMSRQVEIIEKRLDGYEKGKVSLEKFLDYENNNRCLPIFILDKLYVSRDKYDYDSPFYKNIISILGEPEKYLIQKEEKNEILQRYVHMNDEGEFAEYIRVLISFYKWLISK